MLLDSNFKVWLLEVNREPCVTLREYGNTSIEFTHNQLAEVLNVARIHLPSQVARAFAHELNEPKFIDAALNKNLYRMDKSRNERSHQNQLLKLVEDYPQLSKEVLLKNLSPNDVRVLLRSEDELAITKRTERLFPSPDMQKYFKYFSTPRYFNYLLEAWEQKQIGNRSDGIALLNRLCKNGYHLK